MNDLLLGLSLFESDSLYELVIVDDTGGAHDLQSVTRRHPDVSARIVQTPRQRRGDWRHGGLTINTLFGIKEAFADGRARVVVKLDTDSLVISPFSDRLMDRLERDLRIGIIGSQYQRDLLGNPVAPSTWAVNLNKLASLARLERNPRPRLKTAFFGRNRTIRRLIKTAFSNGWDLGASAQAGGYAIGRALFERWSDDGFLSDDLFWLDSELTEDVVIALLCYAADMRIVDDNGVDGVFGVRHMGLGFSPRELFARGYGVVHSVKTEPSQEELHLREELMGMMNVRAARQAPRQTRTSA